MYDLNGDGYISREEMFHMLKNSLIRQPSEEDPDEGIKDLVEITLKKMVREKHNEKLAIRLATVPMNLILVLVFRIMTMTADFHMLTLRRQ